MTLEQAELFGAYVRAKREDHGLSIQSLATLTRVDWTTIRRIEQGKFLAPGPDKLKRIAKVLDIPSHDLFALAQYLDADELPTPKPYLRAKFPDLPAEAVDEADRYLAELMREHGVDSNGPAPGEDEKN